MSIENNYIGKYLGNYHISRLIGSGGFGNVYQGEHTILTERLVAIKLLHAHLGVSEERERFLQEARLLERLKHPYILHIFDVGIHDGFPYLVAEYAPHGSLRDRIKKYAPHPLPIEEALTILLQIGQALHYAHQQNIIHRDLKPENILFNAQGQALLADFGVATILSTASIKYVTIIGTPSYMAPEQFQCSVSRQSDQYALGCIAYELFTGHPPFAASDFFAMGFSHLTKPPVAPTQINPHLPGHIEQAILKAMAKERSDRYPDIKAFIMALHTPTASQPLMFSIADHTTIVDPTTSTSTLHLLHEPTINQSPVTPPPPVHSSLLGTTEPRGGGSLHAQDPITPPPPTSTVFQENPPLSSEEAITPLPITGDSNQPQENMITPVQADRFSHRLSVSATHPAKKRNARKWPLIAIASLLVAVSLIATLFFVSLPGSLHSQVNNPATQQTLTTPAQGATATSVPLQTQTSASTTISTHTPTSVINQIPTATATYAQLPTPTPTQAPTATPSPTPKPSETLTIYFIKGTNGTSTVYSYKGTVTITVSGTGEEYTNKWYDGFYQFTDTKGNSITPYHTSSYPGWTLWINGGVADNYVNPIPSYSSSHVYTFTINAPGGTLTFAIGDTYPKDNSGTLTITVKQD